MKTILDLSRAPALDRDISLGQELNLSTDTSALCLQAEAGTLSAGNQTREEYLEPEEALALAIAEQALADWREAAGTLAVRPEDPRAAALLRETERFFRSRWFRLLMDLDGEALVKGLRSMHGMDRQAPAQAEAYARLVRSMKRNRRRKEKTAQVKKGAERP